MHQLHSPARTTTITRELINIHGKSVHLLSVVAVGDAAGGEAVGLAGVEGSVGLVALEGAISSMQVKSQ
jgi:hypothetical protein